MKEIKKQELLKEIKFSSNEESWCACNSGRIRPVRSEFEKAIK